MADVDNEVEDHNVDDEGRRRAPYQDIINQARLPGKIYIPISFGKGPQFLAVEKKDLIECLLAHFNVDEECWALGEPYLEGHVLVKLK